MKKNDEYLKMLKTIAILIACVFMMLCMISFQLSCMINNFSDIFCAIAFAALYFIGFRRLFESIKNFGKKRSVSE